MIILGIETSCDETACGIVQDGNILLANAVASSVDLHRAYGGVVPEIAARSHLEVMIPVVEEALEQAFPGEKNPWGNIDAIAVTYGPGLGGSLLIGVLTARTLAILKKKPLYAVNHVTAHAYANFLTSTQLEGYKLPSSLPNFPLLALIVSGGHTQLALFKDHFDYELLGQTNDDAAGEAFDKVAKILGLPYPGGPSIHAKSAEGDPRAHKLPKAKMENKYDFSYSGLKTAVLRTAQAMTGKSYDFPSHQIASLLSDEQKADLAASFQYAAVEVLVDKTVLAYEEFRPASIVIAGGVAASSELRRQLSERLPVHVDYTDHKLCTDNGVMIATCANYMAMCGLKTSDPYSLDIDPGLSM